MMATLPVTEPENRSVPTHHERVHFDAVGYRLSGRLAYPEVNGRGVVVIAGPHPFLGGNMNNNVVVSLARGLAEHGFITLRFDYRGVGDSEGPDIDVAYYISEFWRTSKAPDDAERSDDLRAALRYVEQEELCDHGSPFLVGYSFGCQVIGTVLSDEHAPAVVALVAPTVSRHDFSPFYNSLIPKLVVASQDDFATTAEETRAEFERLGAPKELWIPEAVDHFFKGQETQVAARVARFLQQWM